MSLPAYNFTEKLLDPSSSGNGEENLPGLQSLLPVGIVYEHLGELAETRASSESSTSSMSTPCDVYLSFALFNDTALFNCNSTNFTYSEFELGLSDDSGQYTWMMLLLIPLVFFGAAGNLLVCLAISLEKRLQSVTNYFLLSLAVTDMLVSVIVMPFSIIHEFLGYWPLGLELCDFFITSDVLMCTSSILHLCTISLERYLAIRYPLRTRNKSKNIVILKIGLVWAISLAISSPITVLGFVDPRNVLNERNCVLTNDYFVIYGSISAFFIPLVIMIIMYALTIHILYKQSRMCGSQGKDKDQHPLVRRSTSRPKGRHNNKQNNKQGNKQPVERSKSLPITRTRQRPLLHTCRQENGMTTGKVFRKSQSTLDGSLSSQVSEMVPLQDQSAQDSLGQLEETESASRTAELQPASEQSHEPSRLRHLLRKHGLAIRAANLMLLRKEDIHREHHVQTEQKASKVLGIVFAIFVLCWAPFFSVNIMTALCKTCDFDPTLITLFVWLGYISSTLNPIIYTIFNRIFKTTFWKLLRCKYKKLGRARRPGKGRTKRKAKYESVRSQPTCMTMLSADSSAMTKTDTIS